MKWISNKETNLSKRITISELLHDIADVLSARRRTVSSFQRQFVCWLNIHGYRRILSYWIRFEYIIRFAQFHACIRVQV